MTIAVRTRPSLRFRGKSFLALVLAPTVPLRDWLEDVDAVSKSSPGFFDGRAIIVDVSALKPSKSELKFLLAALKMREIRIIGLEGAAAAVVDADMPAPVNGGRPAGDIEMPDFDAVPIPAAPQSQPAPVTALMIEGSVRSGQSVIHTEGDVTILGSVASGAEVVAGGSIHIYGALRGRAIAGCTGNGKARIFCSKFEAELIAIDGLYKTADDLGSKFRGQPIQVNLDGESMILKSMD
ncbi:septum site-determining protein MinC [Microvirga aerophila]|uniref:Probable septum site-determining protein MinC n=1 Tax=Microvirga aerophila TaxID=670291 RepID=A0A512BS68_9HYPH|nr:septum site-determining protein MinC [Microvirga aerophila]GEO14745.1 putative septum site-determining protein MinC [Microvirga aerophila]